MRRETVNLVDAYDPEPSADEHIVNLLTQMRNDDTDSDDGDTGDLSCMMISSINKISDPCLIKVMVEGTPLEMEIDCGSSVSVIGKNQYFSIFKTPLKQYNRQLIVVNGEKLKIEGETTVSVEFNGIEANLKLLVLDCKNRFIPLLGRAWLDVFFSKWRQFFSSTFTVNKMIERNNLAEIEEIKQKYKDVFIKDFSSPIKGFEAELVLKAKYGPET